jgi:hypothetical protein
MTDYWFFDVSAGEVMAINSSSYRFAQRINLLGPDFEVEDMGQAAPDQSDVPLSFIADKAGRYLIAISCIGDGGSGDYTLTRQSIQPKDFGTSSPAQGEVKDGAVQVLKFSAGPDEPLLMRWNSSSWNYTVTIRNDRGDGISLPLTQVDANNRFGILKVDEPTTYLIVLKSTGPPSRYAITLSGLPK